MKIYTSYFYKVRFFDETMIPISTAMWDPKWFHQDKGDTFVFKDKNNVWNGFRDTRLNPSRIDKYREDLSGFESYMRTKGVDSKSWKDIQWDELQWWLDNGKPIFGSTEKQDGLCSFSNCTGCKNCIDKFGEANSELCAFMKLYRMKLELIDHGKLMEDFNNLILRMSKSVGKKPEEMKIVLLVFETPENTCSERIALHDYFNSKGIECSELNV